MERLDKAASRLFNLSRSQARECIQSGAILVNQKTARPDDKVGEADNITYNGRTLCNAPFVYLMLNKPAGVLTATEDRSCRTVLDLLPPALRRKGLFPAGRLDKDTEGFVLLTDDGAFAHRILAPKSHVPKTYFAVLNKPLSRDDLEAEFAKPINLGGGGFSSPARLEILKLGEKPEARLVIFEGMFHQVKRMFAAFGLEVVYLRREAIGGLWLDPSLASGEARAITLEEREKIMDN